MKDVQTKVREVALFIDGEYVKSVMRQLLK